jgi:hypothetical protein
MSHQKMSLNKHIVNDIYVWIYLWVFHLKIKFNVLQKYAIFQQKIERVDIMTSKDEIKYKEV